MNPSRVLSAEYSQQAESYAQYWAPVIHPMARPLLEAMPLGRAGRIVDIGCGSGGLWSLLLEAAPHAQIWGVDPALGMLRAGGDRLRGRVAVMDAAQLGLQAETFDVALLLFVLFHIPDPIRALREIRASLLRGANIGVVVWGADPGLPGLSIWTEELDRAQAAPDPRDPAVMRQSWMDSPAKLASLLHEADLHPERVWNRTFIHRWTPGALFTTQTHCGLPSRRLKSLSPAAQRACTDRVRSRLENLSPDALQYQVEVVYGLARRPA